jgi:hemerythrin superfamily protein
MNAIDLLIQQHQKMNQTLSELADEEDVGEEALRAAGDELVGHMVIEEHVFYPRVRELAEDLIDESFEEHAVARFELARAMVADDETRKARLTVLKELVEHHVEEEEKELLPKIRRAIPAPELERLGERMQAMFERAVELGLDALVKGPGDLDVSAVEGGGRVSTPRRGSGARARGGAQRGGAQRGRAAAR